MEYDDLLTNHLGEFGFYQRIVFLLVSLSAIATCFCNLGIVFLAAIPEHWCYVEELESLSHDDVMDLSIPLEKDDNGDEVHSSCKMYDRCVMYRYTLQDLCIAGFLCSFRPSTAWPCSFVESCHSMDVNYIDYRLCDIYRAHA